MAVEVVGAFAGLALFLILIWIVFMGLGVLAFIFWILMLVDVVKRKFKQENDKIIWVLVVIFAGIVGALVYYFVVKKSSSK